MHIAQVAPLYESVPPQEYGGTERVVSHLTEELVRMGHDVTLFASGDSRTAARLVPCSARSLRTDPECKDPIAHHFVLLERVFREVETFDLVHFHIDYLHFPLTRRHRLRSVTTLHGRLDLPDLAPLYREYRDMPVLSISRAQQKPLPWANWLGTVYHGLPDDLHRARTRHGSYLAFLGRISPEKGCDKAIEIALRSGMELKIAAKIAETDRLYYEQTIKPLLEKAKPLVEFIGEINDREKDDFLGNAHALLFPIDWPEPFGLVLIESMACGTPVVAFRRGSVPEIMEDGVTGFVVDSVDQAVEAIAKVQSLDRSACRARFEERFTARRMAEDYLAVYNMVVADDHAGQEKDGAAAGRGEEKDGLTARKNGQVARRGARVPRGGDLPASGSSDGRRVTTALPPPHGR